MINNNNNKITKFVVYGERCSGTNYLENAIKENFGLQLTYEYGHKHFFCFNNVDNSDDTLFIGIIRNPVYWINSFSRELWHVPEQNKPLNQFLTNNFYSVYENSDKIILRDRNYTNNKIYSNIFELRKMKNYFLINIMPKRVKNYMLINYESLLYNYDYTLNFIKNIFNLSSPYTSYIKIKKYKKSDTYEFVKQRDILLPSSAIQDIWSNVYLPQENILGYFKGDNNEYFKNKDNIKFITSFTTNYNTL
jgi:hypothetical protein